MDITRRDFAKKSALALAVASMSSALLAEGCSSNINVTAMLNALMDSIQSILKLTNPNDPWALQLEAAFIALQKAEADWKSGSTVAIVIDALNTVANVLAVIPLTEAYSPLIDLAVAAVSAVLTNLPATVKVQLKVNLKYGNPHIGRIAINKPHFLQSQQGAYKEQWNRIASNLGLKQAEI